MKQLIIGVLLLVGTISSMASDFTITPAFQQHLTFYNAGNQTLSVNYQFKIHNNMRDPLYLNNQKVVYTSGGFKATLNPAGTTCSFYMEKFNETTPVLPNEDCIIAYTYTIKKSVFLNGKAKSFISTLSVLGQLGLTVNYTATIKLKAFSSTNKHVLLVGLGGTLVDAFKIAVKKISTDDKKYHFINEMIKGGKQDYFIYAGGNSDRPETKQETSNAPGWATILTGVWANKHGINDNAPSDTKDLQEYYEKIRKKDIPTVFNDIKDAIPKAYTVSLAEWNDISTFAKFKSINQDDAASLAEPNQNDVSLAAIKELNHFPTPAFMFLQYDGGARAGHNYGYDFKNSDYIDAIETVLGNANRVLEKVQKLRDSGQQWLVIFTTDHGGKGKESKGRSWQERQVFATYHDPRDKRYSGGGEINAFQGQTNITPTILDYFDIPIPKNLYGKPINASDLPVRSLMLKFGIKEDEAIDNYPQMTADVYPTLGGYAEKINKVLMSADRATTFKAYFFLNDGTYITYNIKDKKIISDPEPIKSHWKCLNDSKISSAKIEGAVAFSNQGKDEYFFLFDNGYCTLCKNNLTHDTTDSPNYPRKVGEFNKFLGTKLKGIDYKRISGIIHHSNDKNVYIFFEGSTHYLRMTNFGANMADSDIGVGDEFPNSWPGLNYNIQTMLSPLKNGDNYRVFIKPIKYN